MNSAALGDLTLIYLSYGFMAAVNSVWMWLTSVTAALRFWRSETRSAKSASASPAVVPNRVLQKTTPYCGKEGDGNAKVKFRVYYGGEESDEREEEGDKDYRRMELGFRWCDEWERMTLRMGDMAWYACQDMAVLDGSMVRLWRRRDAAVSDVDVWYACQDMAVLDGSVVRLWRRRNAAVSDVDVW